MTDADPMGRDAIAPVPETLDDDPRRRGRRTRRILVVAASAALLAGAASVLDSPKDREPDGERLEIDDGDPRQDPVTGELTALGPRDGRDSLRLPVTVDPDAGLEPGQSVTVRGEGFLPGDDVGIVQCGAEAAPVDLGGLGAGAAGCDLIRYEPATADGDGVATGEFIVEQQLSTPVTGTIDCAQVDRCFLAMGAIDDYDRSGGAAIGFVEGLDPLELPELEAAPTSDLADGSSVRLTGRGFDGATWMALDVCAIDPGTCWMVGDIGPDTTGYWAVCPVAATCLPDHTGAGVEVGPHGEVDGEIELWRYLPGPEPGTYVDCAVSVCQLRGRTDTELAPAPIALSFAPGGEPPRAATVLVDPDGPLQLGQRISVLGAGYRPGTTTSLLLCATERGQDHPAGCDWFVEAGDAIVGADGRLSFTGEIPTSGVTVHLCWDADCSQFDEIERACLNPGFVCDLRVETYPERGGPQTSRPWFPPAPHPVTLRDG